MKKGNIIAFVIAVIISVFLLWLWYFLGFDHIDYPFDLILSIIWWIMVVAFCFIIYRVEKKRQERARTCYIADNYVYNSEAGSVSAEGVQAAIERMHDIIDGLEYSFAVKDMPQNPKFNYVVRSKKFKIRRDEDAQHDVKEELDWQGEVAVVARPDDDPVPFADRAELQQVLTRLYAE